MDGRRTQGRDSRLRGNDGVGAGMVWVVVEMRQEGGFTI